MQAKLEDQHKVLAIAEIDLKIATLNQKIKTLPETVHHKELTIQFETTRDLRIAAETELSDLSGEINRAENDVEQVAKRIEKDEIRLNAGQGTPKELEQLQIEYWKLYVHKQGFYLPKIRENLLKFKDSLKFNLNYNLN